LSHAFHRIDDPGERHLMKDLEALFALASHGDPRALNRLLEIAETGEAQAMFLLGRVYDLSRDACSIEPDIVAARSWYERAADANCALAQFALGNMHEYGEGAPKDEVVARHWYECAAKQGYAEAQMSYARMLQRGLGGNQSNSDAASWYRKAANQGHDLAATNLGIMHYQREVAEASDGIAFTFFGMAADKLDGVAHLMLAEMWLEGRGTAQDGGRALLHYCIASMLLPDGSNLERATRQREFILAKYPEHRSEFESRAASYISSRS
jgi:TPR repeat protein